MNEQELRQQIAQEIAAFAHASNQGVLESLAVINEPSIEADLLTSASHVNQAFETAIMIVLGQVRFGKSGEIDVSDG